LGADTASPDTAISGLPIVRARRKRTLAFFNVASSEPGSTFKCSIDGSPFFPCTNPVGLILRRGPHSLTAVAVDRAGNIDPSPARFAFTVRSKKHRHHSTGKKKQKKG
jgi:hypothetical protein